MFYWKILSECRIEGHTQHRRLRHNPCFIGRYSQRISRKIQFHWLWEGHNPCFIGRYSQSAFSVYINNDISIVIILVLLEDTLREMIKIINKTYISIVIILVLLEDTLRAIASWFWRSYLHSVIILVLLEDTLRVMQEVLLN